MPVMKLVLPPFALWVGTLKDAFQMLRIQEFPQRFTGGGGAPFSIAGQLELSKYASVRSASLVESPQSFLLC